MQPRYSQYLFWLLLLWLSPFCRAQGVTIRVIDVTNGHPLRKEQVSVSLLYDKSEKAPAKYDALVHLETDVNGEAQFNLPEPAPSHLWITIRLTSEHWRCACLDLVLTQDVIEKGTVATGLQTSGTVVKAKPGEIVFLARPFTFFERLLYPLLKE